MPTKLNPAVDAVSGASLKGGFVAAFEPKPNHGKFRILQSLTNLSFQQPLLSASQGSPKIWAAR